MLFFLDNFLNPPTWQNNVSHTNNKIAATEVRLWQAHCFGFLEVGEFLAWPQSSSGSSSNNLSQKRIQRQEPKPRRSWENIYVTYMYTDSFQIKWRLHCPKCFCHLVFPGFHEHQAPWQSVVHPKLWNPLPMKGKWCTRSVQFGLWGNKLVRINCFKHVMFWTCNVPTQMLKLEFSLKSSNQISHHSRVVKSTNRFGAYLSPSLSSSWCDY